jgi:putative nucleotidyltransferase with HDIG domain
MKAGRWLYRARQFFSALLDRVGEEDMQEARLVLGPRLSEMFACLPRQYRLHGLQVYRRVRQAGCQDLWVWQAALLHDAGKYDPATGRHVTLMHRVAIVLLKAVPGGRRMLAWLARPLPTGVAGLVLYPFYLSKHHARLGAQLARQHGAHDEVVRLIARHHARATLIPGLRELRAADESS